MTAIPRYRPLRLCAQGGGYEAIPEGSTPLDLTSVRARLETAGFSVVDARVMLIVRGDPEITVARSGRVLLKTSDPDRAEAAWNRFWKVAQARTG